MTAGKEIEWEEKRDAEIRDAAPEVTVLVATSDMGNTPCWAIKEALRAKGFQVGRVTVKRLGEIGVDLGALGEWP